MEIVENSLNILLMRILKVKYGKYGNIPELEECNFTHFQEILEDDYNIKISYTALSNF